ADLALAAPGRAGRAPRGASAGAGARAAGRPGRVRQQPGPAQRRAGQLPAVRARLHARADGAGPGRRHGAARADLRLLRLARAAAGRAARRTAAPFFLEWRVVPRKPASMPMTARKIFVTTALPYANGHFHIGHIMEYIQADTWVRYQRMQ